MPYIKNWEQVVVSETDDKKKDNSVDVHDILLDVIVVCLQIYKSHKQSKYLETKIGIIIIIPNSITIINSAVIRFIPYNSILHHQKNFASIIVQNINVISCWNIFIL